MLGFLTAKLELLRLSSVASVCTEKLGQDCIEALRSNLLKCGNVIKVEEASKLLSLVSESCLEPTLNTITVGRECVLHPPGQGWTCPSRFAAGLQLI